MLRSGLAVRTVLALGLVGGLAFATLTITPTSGGGETAEGGHGRDRGARLDEAAARWRERAGVYEARERPGET